MAQAVEQLGKVQIKVGQKGVHAHGIGQRNAQVAPVLMHPVLQRRNLKIAQPHPQRLVGLEVLVRHGANGHQAQIARQQHIARALEPLRRLRGQGLHHFALPVAAVAPAQAKVEQLERMAQRGLLRQCLQLLHFGGQALAAPSQRAYRVKAAKVQLVDNGQRKNLEAHHMHLRATRDDVQLVALGPGADEVALKLEDAQEVDKVAADVAQSPHVVEFVRREAQGAQVVQRGVHFGQQLRQRIGRRVAAHKTVFALGLGVAVQQRLPHREFVQIGVEQAGDDRVHGQGSKVRAAFKAEPTTGEAPAHWHAALPPSVKAN